MISQVLPTVPPVSTTPTPQGHRSRGDRPNRRQAIIDAALELATEKPFDEVTVADVARRAGVAHGLLFYYFADKWAITTEALSQILAGLDAAQEPSPDEISPPERIEGFVRRHLEFIVSHRASYLTLMQGAAITRPDVRELLHEARRQGVEMLAGILGHATPLSPMENLRLWSWLAMLDLCTERVLVEDDLDREAVVAWLAARLIADWSS